MRSPRLRDALTQMLSPNRAGRRATAVHIDGARPRGERITCVSLGGSQAKYHSAAVVFDAVQTISAIQEIASVDKAGPVGRTNTRSATATVFGTMRFACGKRRRYGSIAWHPGQKY